MKAKNKRQKNSIWGLSLTLTILNVLLVIANIIAGYYVIKAYMLVGDNALADYIVNKIPHSPNTYVENGSLFVIGNEIPINELMTLGLNFITAIVIVNFVGNVLCLISGILGLKYYATPSKYKTLFGWGFAGIVGGVLSVRIVSIILFIIYTVQVHTYRFEDEDIMMSAKHAS